MNTNKRWFVVYTKPRWEKKVAELLTKKKIENYCPLNKIKKQWADRKKIVLEPLFTCYLFVRVTEGEHVPLLQTAGIVNLVYWLGVPAVIRDIEIDVIQKFLAEHSNVQLEQTRVNVHDRVPVVQEPLMQYKGKVFSAKSKTVKVNLPSLGYHMVAEIESTNIELISSPSISRQSLPENVKSNKAGRALHRNA